MRSLINNSKECYICGSTYNIEKHHMVFGSANRKKADEDGLWCNLCHSCHQAVHNQDIWEKKALQELAQEKYEEKIGTREQFIKRYGKSYL